MARTAQIIVGALVALGSAPCAPAHDFWIHAGAYHAPVGTRVALDLRIGDALPGDSFPRTAAKFERFAVVPPTGPEQPVPGTEGQTPAGAFAPAEPGFHVIAYRGRANRVELDPATFEAYLREKGLDEVAEDRRRGGRSAEPGRELFSRCAKALVLAGSDWNAPGFDRDAGLPLELTPLTSPGRTGPDGPMTLRLTLHGAPHAGALVTALHADTGAALRGRTSTDGTVRLGLHATPGAWIVCAVHMRPAPAGSNADWESLWASLTLGVPGGAAVPAADRSTAR